MEPKTSFAQKDDGSFFQCINIVLHKGHVARKAESREEQRINAYIGDFQIRPRSQPGEIVVRVAREKPVALL